MKASTGDNGTVGERIQIRESKDANFKKSWHLFYDASGTGRSGALESKTFTAGVPRKSSRISGVGVRPAIPSTISRASASRRSRRGRMALGRFQVGQRLQDLPQLPARAQCSSAFDAAGRQAFAGRVHPPGR